MCKTDIKITTKEVMQVEGCSQATAHRRLSLFKDMLSRPFPWQYVTVNEYCDLNELPKDEVYSILKMTK